MENAPSWLWWVAEILGFFAYFWPYILAALAAVLIAFLILDHRMGQKR
jgi:hypothetical protein